MRERGNFYDGERQEATTSKKSTIEREAMKRRRERIVMMIFRERIKERGDKEEGC